MTSDTFGTERIREPFQGSDVIEDNFAPGRCPGLQLANAVGVLVNPRSMLRRRVLTGGKDR